jgi:amidohydrolase
VSDEIGVERLALEPQLIETRRLLHRRPELAFEEHKTAALVVERLVELGYEPRSGVGGTGVVADLEGAGGGPTLLIRADMDALALDEVAGRPYGSQTAGRMHACGHDAHIPARCWGSPRCCARVATGWPAGCACCSNRQRRSGPGRSR